MQTNYRGHELLYQERRARGEDGWDTAEVTEENIALLVEADRAGWLGSAGSMLEIGCGAGNLTSWFARCGWRAHGLDIAKTAIAWARERAAEDGHCIDYEVGDARTLEPFRTQRFDLVFDGHCLHCIIGADRAKFLAAARDVQKPQGRLLIMTMSGTLPVCAMRGAFDTATRCQIVNGDAVRYIGDAQDIVAEVQAAGFEVCQLREVARRHEAETDQLLISARRAIS